MSPTITAETIVPVGMAKLVLRSYEGVSYRLVSTKPARDCTPAEIPIIDLEGIHDSVEARKEIAQKLLHSAETIGFFYIKNHGISDETIANTVNKSKEFFSLPVEEKRRAATDISSYGYKGLRERQVNPSNSKDRKENFNFHYKPEFDPTHQGRLSQVPQKVQDHIPKDDIIWKGLSVPGFQDALIAHWTSCLTLARGLIRVVALALDLPESYFDKFTTYPGGDFSVNFYPGHGDAPIEDPDEVGIGAHTDLQILTLLWQDEHKGLQVLDNNNEWMCAPPIPGTLVVNIGDFLMRLTNDRLKSTVHRVIQHGKEDRFSIPFFFGFNFDERLGVIPTCTDEKNPPKYQPSTCGEVSAAICEYEVMELT
ncbi:hypothetical protein BGZ61DRAFT_366746 [Ilyonectria robusta]|uniref:uncharacterized protein n=1 Tax=Ilyonectria robusta TaxID=1079257 RepID=UPI001E8D60D5|nr:uncharacterized protein BGZ61DRAFT_366746 [Ilyonectria robusta]KAH8665430.1 hypothetical protein BGZ61DRAFT_366746 [Ilyonectria robusta]